MNYYYKIGYENWCFCFCLISRLQVGFSVPKLVKTAVISFQAENIRFEGALDTNQTKRNETKSHTTVGMCMCCQYVSLFHFIFQQDYDCFFCTNHHRRQHHDRWHQLNHELFCFKFYSRGCSSSSTIEKRKICILLIRYWNNFYEILIFDIVFLSRSQ